MYWNRMDICEAYYIYACQYHGGQWSTEYEVFGRLVKLNFKPGLSVQNWDTDNENVKEILGRLISGESTIRPRGVNRAKEQ